jgi:WD40 repeat protein
MTSLHVGKVLEPATTWGSYASSYLFTPGEVRCPIHCLSINGPRTQVALATDRGFSRVTIASGDPPVHHPLDGGIGAISILQETDVVAISGGGDIPHVGSNSVCLIQGDSDAVKVVDVSDKVLGLSLLQDKVIVITLHHAYIYSWNRAGAEMVCDITTIVNPWALFAVHSQSAGLAWLLLPETQEGHVGMYTVSSGVRRYYITAHNHRVGLMSFSPDGSQFATASEGSTNIKLWARTNGQLIRELRRGTKPCRTYFAAFDLRLKYLATISLSGTLHIFSLGRREPPRAYEVDPEVRNVESKLQPLSLVSSYFDSEWSCAECTLPTEMAGIPAVCSFCSDNELVVMDARGNCVQYLWDPTAKGTITLKSEKMKLLA